MTGSPAIVSRQEWMEARLQLLEKEKALTRFKDEVASERQAMPWVRVDEKFRFDTMEGETSLSGLFGGRSQLVVYHFMFAPDWDAPCKICSFWADNFDGIDRHLAARDTAFTCVSTAPLAKLMSEKTMAGWRFNWVSDSDKRFGAAFGVNFYNGQENVPEGYNYTGRTFGEEMPGLSAFVRGDEGVIYHNYSTYARGLELLNGAYQILDMTARGRNESEFDMPMAWVQRRSQYPPP